MFEKGCPMTKEEVAILVRLINDNNVVTNKATNAHTNQLKEAAWITITNQFNTSVPSRPRKLEQLKLKWDNLKKSVRKRTDFKNNTGESRCMSSNNTLDRVASILDAANRAHSVKLDSDPDPLSSSVDHLTKEVYDGVGTDSVEDDSLSSNIELPNDVVDIPKTKKTKCGTIFAKRKIIEKDTEARIARNTAMAEYYVIKRKKLELEMENELINSNIKLEIEKLKLENEKLRLQLFLTKQEN